MVPMYPNTGSPFSIYFCGSEQCVPGHFFGPAVRTHYLIHVVLHGAGIYQRNGQTYRLHAGDAFLIFPLESTYYQADQNDPWEYAWIGFDGTMVPLLLENTCFRNSCIYRCPDSPDAKESAAQKVLAALQTFHGGNNHSISLAGDVLKLFGLMQEESVSSSESYSKQYLAKAKEYMENNFSYHIRISDIASFVGIDRTYLYRLFMEEEHLSPKQYLFQLRLRNATNMLRDPRYTVTEIAYSCGFKDASAFCNYFKKAMGVTPRKYRPDLTLEKTPSEHR